MAQLADGRLHAAGRNELTIGDHTVGAIEPTVWVRHEATVLVAAINEWL